MIYLLLLVFLFSLSFTYDFLNKKIGKTFFYSISCFLLIIFSGLRYRVGGDTLNYMVKYELIPDFNHLKLFSASLGVQAEPGWIILASLTKLIGTDFFWMQIIQAILVNTAIFVFFKRHCKYIFSCVLFYYIMFYLYFNFEILRECLSISIFLIYGIKFLWAKKYVWYCISVAAAMLFHTSAVFLFFVPFLYNYVQGKKINYFVVCTVIYVFGLLISPFFADFLTSSSILSVFSDKFGVYLEYNFTISGKISAYLLYIITPLLVYKYSKNRIENNNLNVFLIIYAFLGALTSLFPIFFRFINYMTPILIISITLILIGIVKNQKDKLRMEHSIFFIICILLFSNLKILTRVDENIRWYSWWYPYYSIFENKEDTDREQLWQKQLNK